MLSARISCIQTVITCGSGKRKQLKQVKRNLKEDPWEAVNDPFTKWLKARGLPPQKVQAIDIPGKGKGLVAFKEINKGEATLNIPKDMLISSERAVQELEYGEHIKDLPAWSILAMYVIELRRSWEQMQNDVPVAQHKLYEDAHYASILPEKTYCVFEWGDLKDVEKIISSSTAMSLAKELFDGFNATWKELQPRIKQLQLDVSKEDVRWAVSILLTRLAKLPNYNEEGVLVPWADLVNHSPRTNASFHFFPYTDKKKGGVVRLKPDSNVKEGTELTVSYGELTNADAMIRYGFFVQDNPHDGLNVEVELKANDRAFKEKKHALNNVGWQQLKCAFPVKSKGVPQQLLAYVAYCNCRIKDKKDIEPLADYLFKKGQFPVLDNVDLKVFAFEQTLAILQQQQKRYNLKQDQELAKPWQEVSKDCSGISFTEYLKIVWAVIRMEEHRILESNIRKIESILKQLK